MLLKSPSFGSASEHLEPTSWSQNTIKNLQTKKKIMKLTHGCEVRIRVIQPELESEEILTGVQNCIIYEGLGVSLKNRRYQ